MTERSGYTGANRQAWNRAAPVHAQHNFQRLVENFKQPGYSTLDEIAVKHLRQIGLEGRSVAQISCNNGRELLSIKNLGAARCTGFDISDGFIEQAHELSASSGIECEFVRTDAYEIPERYDGQFDLVYISVGTLGWMPDLPGFFQVVRRLLSGGGWLFIYEMHPILIMFEQESKNPLDLVNSYFSTQPFAEEGGLDYYGNTSYDSPVSYWFHYKLSDIISGVLEQGLAVRSLTEYPHDVSDVFAYLVKEETRPPLSFTLLAELQEA